jgi:hypothetical protein
MRRNELKSRVLQEWERWLQTQPINPSRPTDRDTLKFFCELQDRRSPLLDFRSGGRDKWQIIRAWLLNDEGVAQAAPRPPRRLGRPPLHPRAAQDNKPGGKRRT